MALIRVASGLLDRGRGVEPLPWPRPEGKATSADCKIGTLGIGSVVDLSSVKRRDEQEASGVAISLFTLSIAPSRPVQSKINLAKHREINTNTA
jgi:hypothetical protein